MGMTRPNALRTRRQAHLLAAGLGLMLYVANAPSLLTAYAHGQPGKSAQRAGARLGPAPTRLRPLFAHAPESAFTTVRWPGLTGASAASGRSIPRLHSPPTELRAATRDPAALPADGAFGTASRLSTAIRWLQHVGLVIVLGTVAFCYVVFGLLDRTTRGDGLRAVVWYGTARNWAARVGLWATLAIGAAALLR